MMVRYTGMMKHEMDSVSIIEINEASQQIQLCDWGDELAPTEKIFREMLGVQQCLLHSVSQFRASEQTLL